MRLLLVCFALLLTPNVAYSFCMQPSEPYCVSSFSAFNDEYEFKNCRSEVESFVEDSKNYVECLVNEHNQKINEQKQKVEEVIDDFNRRAKR